MTIKNHKILNSNKLIGLALGGGKTDRACLATVEYYPQHKKVFLSHLYERIGSDEHESADLKIHRLLTEEHRDPDFVAMDVPLQMPKCTRCRKKCPGFEVCTEPEIKWLRKGYQKLNEKKRPQKTFAPYMERCAEFWLATELEEKFHPQHALGANLAPLTARGMFITRRLAQLKMLEVQPAITLWRIGRSLGIQKSYLRHHKHSVEGLAIRKAVIEKLSERNVAFLYEQDMRTMINNAQAFDAFLCAFTALLTLKKQTEPRPADYPRRENWVEIPKSAINWSFLDF